MKIVDWDKKTKIYTLKEARLVRASLIEDEVPDGFLKRFLFCKKLIAYREDNQWFLIVNSKKISQNEILSIDVKFCGFFVDLLINLESEILRFKSIEIMEYFTKLIDPTYDDFDAQLVFAIWLKNKILPEPLSEEGQKIMDEINKNES